MRVRVLLPLVLASLALGASCAPDKEADLPTLSPRVRTSAALHHFDGCDTLTEALRSHLREEMRTRLLELASDDWYWRGILVAYDAPADATSGASPEAADTRVEGVDFSGTNNQEAGVDEADFVKTDGFYIYVLNGNHLEILGTPTIGSLTAVGSLDIGGWPTEMLLDGDTATIFSTVYLWGLPTDSPLVGAVRAGRTSDTSMLPMTTLTKVTVVDLTDRSAPSVAREVYLEGYYQTAREVSGSVRLVSYSWLDIPGLLYWPELPSNYYDAALSDSERQAIWLQSIALTIAKNDALIATLPLDAFVPRLYERASDGSLVAHAMRDEADCTNFAVADDGMSHGVTSILSMNLRDASLSYESDHILSNWSTVYASASTLVIAEPAQDWWWYYGAQGIDEATNIHRFDIATPGVTTYTGSGRVDGTVLGQFALSESGGDIRVASTTGQWNRWWMSDPTPPENHVFVLRGDASLETIGHVGGIATGERLWSSRFVGDKAYLVTFQNVDPLWTVDLSDPTAPAVVGELEVPGVSTYIHPLTGDRLLTIGFGGTEAALDWTTALALFDVTDFANPRLAASLSLAPAADASTWSWSWSEATYQHKAFQYWAPLGATTGVLAVPLSTYRYTYDSMSGFSGYEYKSLLQLVRVDTTGETLTPFASVDHSAFFNSDPTRYWDWRDVRRSIFMRDQTSGTDYVYAVSDRGVTSHAIVGDTLELQAQVALPGTDFTWLWSMAGE